MIKMRIKKDDKAIDGHVFNMDINPICDDVIVYFGQDVADACCTYGLRVYLQKQVAEAVPANGRDWKLVEAKLSKLGIPFTITDWVKGVKVEDERVQLVKGYTVDEIKAAIASLRK